MQAAALAECELMTRPFAVENGEIYINASALGGSVTLECCDTTGQPIEGFAFGDCVPFTGDSIAAEVEWKGKPDLSKLECKVIRVKVRARNAKLYSFFFPDGAYTGE